jgi:hypothetical protein
MLYEIDSCLIPSRFQKNEDIEKVLEMNII